jgi:hypothetical protein
MADERARHPSRKRYFGHLLSLAGGDRPAKQRKGEDVSPNNDNQGSITTHGGSADSGLLGDQVEIQGTGTKDNPIRFPTWETGNVISSKYHGSLIELSDDEDEEEKKTSRRTTPLSPLKPSNPCSLAGEVTEASVRGRASLVQKLPSPEHKSLPSSVDCRSAHTPVDLSEYLTYLYGPLAQASSSSAKVPRSPPSPLLARTSAFTKPKSTTPSLQSEALDQRRSVSLEDPTALVKLEELDIDNSDDDFFEDSLLDCAAMASGRLWDTCCGGVSTTTHTQIRHKKPVPEEKHSKHDGHAGKPWIISVKQEHEKTQAIPDLTSYQLNTASEVDKQVDNSDDLFFTRKVLSAKPVLSEESQLVTSQAPVELAEPIKRHKTLPLSTRKRLFFENYHHLKRVSLEKRVEKYYSSIQSERFPDRCWLYTGDRLPKPPVQGLTMTVTFRHDDCIERLSLNVLVVKMLLEGRLSQEHIQGLIEHSWHASHLCGNWTCLNTEHVVIEPGSVNSNRNTCFKAVDQPCSSHVPKCLKHLKLEKSRLRPATERTSQQETMV